jgi:HTH-type transcriptional regulator / antitoxin HigA
MGQGAYMGIDRKPAETFPPGEYLKDELEERGWSQVEFAEIIGRPVRVVNEIIAGKVQITPKTATELAAALGTSAQFWLNLEMYFQLSRVDAPPERIAREAALRAKLPVREMVKRGWLAPSDNFEVIEARALRFFELSSINDDISLNHAARKNAKKIRSGLQWAWIFRTKQIASAVRVGKYSEAALRAALPKLEALMTEPEEIRHVPRILAECGVRFTIVEPVPGSEIQGVCFWINDNKSPVIGLSLNYDRIDNFWFNLRHEVEHVLRGDGKDEPMVDVNPLELEGLDESDVAAERAANSAASEFCAPSKGVAGFIARLDPIYTDHNLVGFSKIVKRHPGIVAGQIRHHRGRFDIYKKHLVKVRHILTQTAITDGYGKACPVEL